MRIISFAWTTPQLLASKKTVTRRRWKECRLKPGELVQAWDKQPRFGGKRVAIIRIVKVSRVPLHCIDAEDMKREGFEDQNPTEFVGSWIETYGGFHTQKVWRIEFEMVKKEVMG